MIKVRVYGKTKSMTTKGTSKLHIDVKVCTV